jgi:DNA-directed RNA polymerase subunit RPC12/RpoP
MIRCPECNDPLNGFKLLFKSDYSKIECGNCGSKWNLKVRRNKFYRIFGAVFGVVSALVLALIIVFFGLLWLGVIAAVVLLGIVFLIMRNFVEKFIEIIKY